VLWIFFGGVPHRPYFSEPTLPTYGVRVTGRRGLSGGRRCCKGLSSRSLGLPLGLGRPPPPTNLHRAELGGALFLPQTFYWGVFYLVFFTTVRSALNSTILPGSHLFLFGRSFVVPTVVCSFVYVFCTCVPTTVREPGRCSLPPPTVHWAFLGGAYLRPVSSTVGLHRPTDAGDTATTGEYLHLVTTTYGSVLRWRDGLRSAAFLLVCSPPTVSFRYLPGGRHFPATMGSGVWALSAHRLFYCSWAWAGRLGVTATVFVLTTTTMLPATMPTTWNVSYWSCTFGRTPSAPPTTTVLRRNDLRFVLVRSALFTTCISAFLFSTTWVLRSCSVWNFPSFLGVVGSLRYFLFFGHFGVRWWRVLDTGFFIFLVLPASSFTCHCCSLCTVHLPQFYALGGVCCLLLRSAVFWVPPLDACLLEVSLFCTTGWAWMFSTCHFYLGTIPPAACTGIIPPGFPAADVLYLGGVAACTLLPLFCTFLVTTSLSVGVITGGRSVFREADFCTVTVSFLGDRLPFCFTFLGSHFCCLHLHHTVLELVTTGMLLAGAPPAGHR